MACGESNGHVIEFKMAVCEDLHSLSVFLVIDELTYVNV